MRHRIAELTLVMLSFVLPSAAQVNGSGNPGVIPIWMDSTTLGNSTIFETQGMVGVGTTSPTATLHVMGPNGSSASPTAPTVLQVNGGSGVVVQKQFGPLVGGGAPINITSGSGAVGWGCSPLKPLLCSSGGTGGSFVIASGSGGTGGCINSTQVCHIGGAGGSLLIAAGNGGLHGGLGGSIALQPGTGGSGTHAGISGNVLLAPSAGNVGIGETSPANTLEVKIGGTTLADAWMVRSSLRFKTDIQPLQGALEKVEQLQGVSYKRKDDGRHEIGVVAEEVYKVVPEVVSNDPQTNEVQGVDYSRLAALLIEAMKTQQAEIQQLKTRIEQLSTKQPMQNALSRK